MSPSTSAVSNPNDPILSQGSAAFTDLMADGSTDKTNLWDALNAGAYNAFYPFDITPPVIPADTGLPVPDSALLPALQVAQQDMPGIAAPYLANDPQGFARFDSDIQFFSSFAFGYDTVVNWFAAEEISRGFFFLTTTAARGRALANLHEGTLLTLSWSTA
jgi:hypothetical protein